MSTETIETVTHFCKGREVFLPLAPGVLYEFLENRDSTETVLQPDELQPGKTYTMVVSDQYGLRRYETGDLFLCAGFISGLPDLRFRHRRNVEYSFTGEKLTSAQVSAIFGVLRREFSVISTNAFLSCVPSQPLDAPVPHYKVLILGTSLNHVDGLSQRIANRCDELLRATNCEYDNKRATGRLGPISVMPLTIQDFASQFGHGTSWEAQFKLLPLYQKTWESGALLPEQ